MWHRLSFVAKTQRLDGEALARFAANHERKFGLVQDGDELQVSTWHVDGLVKAFREHQSAASEGGAGAS